MVVFHGNRGREAKRSEWSNWHNSFDEAKAFLVENAEKEVEAARMNLERKRGKLGQLRGMREAPRQIVE